MYFTWLLKGGSAALFYSLKYNFPHVVVSCPQLLIGEYVSENWPVVTTHMLGHEFDARDVNYLDSLIPSLLSSDEVIGRNIYLVTSESDEQFPTQIQPFLSLFDKYSNFNLFKTNSTLAWQHNKVTKYNLPIILSILYAHSEGIFPRYGFNVNGSGEFKEHTKNDKIEKLKLKKKSIASLKKAILADGLFYPDGHAINVGYDCSEYEKIQQSIIFHNGTEKYNYPLAKVLNKDLSYQYYEDVFCDYSAGQVTSKNRSGINIQDLPKGCYNISCEIITENFFNSVDFEGDDSLNSQELIGNKIYSIYSHFKKVYLSILDIKDDINNKSLIIDSITIDENKLFINGLFINKGVFLKDWREGLFYLSVNGKNKSYSYPLGNQNDHNLNDFFSDHHAPYQKSRFSTIKNYGIELQSIPSGVYELKIHLCKKGVILSEKIPYHLEKCDGVHSVLVKLK